MAERTIVLARITVHFLKNGEVMEGDYWAIPRRGKEPVLSEVPGSERPCVCENVEQCRADLEAQEKFLRQPRRGGGA